MQRSFTRVTSPRFERLVPAGRHDLAFRVAFGTDGRTARFFGVTRMTVWRWRHERSPLPLFVIKALPDILQAKVAEAHEAQQDFRYFLAEPPTSQTLLSSHPIQLDDGSIVFVKRRRANVGRRA